MINLDNIDEILKTQGGRTVLDSVDNFGKQLEQSWQESQQIHFPESYRQTKAVVVSGMGGSRFPALIVHELLKQEITVPYLINDDYHLPGFVDEHTLVILSSYSGTTEEVIANGKEALGKKAKLAGITAGGDIAQFLGDANAPVYMFNPVHNPSQQPRIGFGYSVGGHLGFLYALGLLSIEKQVIDNALTALPDLTERFGISIPTDQNPAKQLALALYGKYPYYIVSEFLTGIGNAVANQTNETAKAISSYRVVPELNHHLMEGLKFPSSLHETAVFVFFYSFLYSAPIQKRFRITKDVVEQNNIKTIWHELKGTNKIEQAFELMSLGIYMTMYLAALYGQDPSAIPYVDYFKERLKEE